MIAVVQLDGFGREPMERLLAAGELPNLAAALNESPPQPLETPAPLFPAAVYPSLYSGVSVGEHGLIYPFQWDPTAQRVVTADHLPKPAMLWARIGAAGGRSLIIDPYECAPADARNTRVISGWQLSERVVLRRWSRPLAFWPRALASASGGGGRRPPRATETFGPRRERELEALARGLLRAPQRVALLFERELATHPALDLAWVNFVATHIGGHRLWDSPQLDAIYRATDHGLGRVLAALPPGTRVLIVAPLGMTADSARADLLPEMLDRVLRGGPAGAGGQAGGDDSGAMWRLRAAVPAGLRSALAAAIPAPAARELTARLELRGVEWSRTRAFAQPSDNQGYVRLNLRGRERQGIVEPDEANELCDEIAAGLSSFTNLDGSPAVESIVRPAESRQGSRDGLLPDLVVRWSAGPGGDLSRVRSPRFGEVVRHGAGSGRNGNHPGDQGWVSAAGLAPGSDGRVELTRLPAAIETMAGLGIAGSPVGEGRRPADIPA